MASIISTNVLNSFNFQPVNTTGGANTNYTVPTNRYARVVVTLDGDTYISSTNSATTVYGLSISNKCCTMELWLKSGDVLSFSNSAASTTLTSGGSATVTEARVNGTTVARMISRLTIAMSSGSSTIAGNSNVCWFSTEYNNS